VTFPWLCDSFVIRLAVNGAPAYLVDSQAMRGVHDLEPTREHIGRLEYRSDDVVLPDSHIQFEWGYEPRRG
jgi:hypothetical protein